MPAFHSPRFCIRLLVPCLLPALLTVSAQGGERPQQDARIDDFTLKSHFGKEYSLADFDRSEVLVVAFLGAECPLAKLYAPRLARLSKRWKPGQVAVVGIDSNRQDSIREIAAFAERNEIPFPILKDNGNAIADRFGATRTPEVFVLDRQRTIRYRGRIDDQYGFDRGVGYQRPAATRDDLGKAVEELLAGRPVSVASTAVAGCLIGRVRPADATSDVTYSNQIARIFQARCLECHRPGRIGPFSMTDYEEVAGWGEMIREVVDQGRMPPWHANPSHGEFQNDQRLTDEEKQLIAAWVDAGCPEGDRGQLPEPAEFVEGWAIGQPDQIIYMSEKPVEVPAEGVVDYYHFVVDPGWTEDKWITAAEAKPGSLETVHHILVFVLPPGGRGGGLPAALSQPESNQRGPARGRNTGGRGAGRTSRGGRAQGGGFGGGISGGNLIAGYAPGTNPMLDTDGQTAMHVKAGSRLIFQLHYTPNGRAQQDRSYVGFRFTDPANVKYVARSTAVANAFFAIPPGAENHEATAEGTFETDTLVASFTPHLHSRGKSFRYEVFYPTGGHEILLDVPAYDFNWQTTYVLAEPKLIPKGTRLLCTAHWDNSENNLSNPDPTKLVTWGDQTWEEMMIGFYVEIFPKGQVPPETSGARAFRRIDPEQIFRALDANRDGKLSQDELPDRLGDRIGLADRDGDGAVSLEELTNLLKLFTGGGQGD